jgi:predicted RNA-binding protein with RPS1 domain
MDDRACALINSWWCAHIGLVHFTQVSRTRVNPDTDDLLELVGGQGATVNVKVLEVKEVTGSFDASRALSPSPSPLSFNRVSNERHSL